MTTRYIIGVVFAAAIGSSSPSLAKYVADGQIKGNVCTGYLFFETCRDVNIDAVKGTDGKLYTVKDTFDDVDEYEDHGVTTFCFVRVKRDDWSSSVKSWIGWIGWIMGYNWQQTFLIDKGDGKFERADPEYLVFKCKKQE
jgi:hypothetical protein